jgi:hypothetical protein
MKQRRRVSHARNLPIRPAHADHHRGQHTRNGTVDHHHHEEAQHAKDSLRIRGAIL